MLVCKNPIPYTPAIKEYIKAFTMASNQNRMICKLLFLSSVSLSSVPLQAHHSFAMYNRDITYVFTGVVDSINPDASHLQINFVPLDDARSALVRDADGNRVTWSVEMEGAAMSAREGISTSTFPRGTVFSVGLTPLRNGEPGGSRIGGLFRCPENKPPATGMHCDTVTGAIHIGEEALATPTAIWSP
jgi:hypothetical protein